MAEWLIYVAVALAAALAVLHLLERLGVPLPPALSWLAKPAGYVAAALGGAIAVLQAMGRPDLDGESGDDDPTPPERPSAEPTTTADDAQAETDAAADDEQEPSSHEIADDITELTDEVRE